MSSAKHPSQRHGHRTAAENRFDELAPESVTWPDPQEHWHPAASRWYASLAESAQSVHYQQSDVALAWVVAENLARHMADDRPMPGSALGAFMTANEQLLATAGARRRVRLELARPDTGTEQHRLAAVSSISVRRPGSGA